MHRASLTSAALGLLLSSTAPLGCAARDPGPEGVARATQQALTARDDEALWALSSPDARAQLLALHRRVLEARAEARLEGLPMAEVDRTLGGWLTAGIAPDTPGTGPALMARLAELGFLRSARHPTPDPSALALSGDEAVTLVSAPSGGFLALGPTTEGWRSLLLSEALRTEPVLRELAEVAEAALEGAALRRAGARLSRDPSTAWGAANLARGALSADPPDLTLLHALLADDAHAAMLEAFAHYTRLRKRVPIRDGAAREAALNALGVGASTPRSPAELWQSWAKGPAFLPPFSPGPDPRDLEPLGPDTALLRLASGPPIALVRSTDQRWRIDGYGETLRKTLVVPLAELAAGD